MKSIKKTPSADIGFISIFSEQLEKILTELGETRAELIALKSTMQQSSVMDIPNAAKYMNVSEGTIRNHLRSGNIPYFQKYKKGNISISKQDIDNFLISTVRHTVDYDKLAKRCFKSKLCLSYKTLSGDVRNILKCDSYQGKRHIDAMIELQLIRNKDGNYYLIGSQIG